jgi:lipoprotein-releasing system permease protein
LAVAISLSVMIVTTALVQGFKREISEKVYGFWGHINIADIRADNSYEALPILKDSALVAAINNIAEVEVDYGVAGMRALTSRAGVKHVQAVARIPAIIATKGSIEGVVIKGLGPDFDWGTLKKFMVQGEILNVENPEARSEFIISEYTANRLEIKAGDQVVLYFLKSDRQIQRRFTVRGIYRTGLEDYDQKFAMAPISIVQELLGWTDQEIGAYEVFIEDVQDVDLINDYIYLEELPAELYSQTIRSKFPAIFEWLELQDVNQMVILGLTLVVAIINMISILLILILERTRMIGIFKALGSRTWQIQKIFLYHASLIIVRGMILGNVLGLLLCWIQKKFQVITLNEQDYYLSYAPVDINPGYILGINAIALFVIMLFLIVPSLLIARIDPVRTIQFR